jgi:ABC-type Fe3+-hydroxamate transport system substrate-binding protein
MCILQESYVSRIAASFIVVSVLLTACGQEAAVPSNTAQAAASPNLAMAEHPAVSVDEQMPTVVVSALPTVVVSAKRGGDRS